MDAVCDRRKGLFEPSEVVGEGAGGSVFEVEHSAIGGGLGAMRGVEDEGGHEENVSGRAFTGVGGEVLVPCDGPILFRCFVEEDASDGGKTFWDE